ncbi:MAG: hypothetical protein OEQ47_17380 [Acidimicrobiia bacterium]|nr:hypothetical protein [Acidimicrobiia bacterium]
MHGSIAGDLRLSTIAPCDLRTSRLVTNLVTSAIGTDTMDIDRVADLQTALFESFIDLVESVEANAIEITVSRSETGLTVRLAALDPTWTSEPSFLMTQVLSTLADRVETGNGAIEFEFSA